MTSKRIAGLGTTVFARMSAEAARTGAINLGQGFPDTDGPRELIDRAVATLAGGEAHQYAPGRGIAPLRRAIAGHQRRHYGLDLDPETEVVVTTGATEAIAAAIFALVDPGDEVVMLAPAYDSYAAVVQLAGGVRRDVVLHAPDFALDVEALRAAISPRSRVLLLNTPHNPTGAVLNDAELAAVAAVAIEHDLVVVSDEVYEHLVFDGGRHTPIATLPGMAERTLTVSSVGKTFSVTGWKIGWASGPAALIDAVVAAKQFLTYTSGGPFQPAVAWALEHGDAHVAELRASLAERRDHLCAGLADLGLAVSVPAGTYFATTDLRSVGIEDGVGFCEALPRTVGVAAIPHQVFHADDVTGRSLVRWAFCKRPEVIGEALRRLADHPDLRP